MNIIDLADPIRDILKEAAEHNIGTDDTADAIVTLVENWLIFGAKNKKAREAKAASSCATKKKKSAHKRKHLRTVLCFPGDPPLTMDFDDPQNPKD